MRIAGFLFLSLLITGVSGYAQDADMSEASEDALVSALKKPRRQGDLKLRIQALDALAAKGTDRALEVVIKFAKSRDPEMKAVAMGSLAKFKGNPKALKALLDGLKDRDPTIRAVTLRAAGKVRDKALIPALINVVGSKKEQESMRVNALKLLVKL